MRIGSRRFFFALAIASGVVGCVSQRAREEAGPSAVLAAFVSALNHADADAIAGLCAPDATAFLPIDAAPTELVGREAIRSSLLAFFRPLREESKGPEYMHVVPKDLHVQSLGSVAIVTFDAGAGPVTARRTLVLEKTQGSWRIKHFHGSNMRQAATGVGP